MEPHAELLELKTTQTEPILALDEEGRICFVATAASSLLGWSSGELCGQPVEILLPPGLRARTADHSFIEQLLSSTGSPDAPPIRNRLLRQDGEAVDLLLVAFPATVADRPLVLLSLQPLAELPGSRPIPAGGEAESGAHGRAVAGDLGGTERLFGLLFQQAPVGLAFLDTACRYVQVNPHLARMNGLPIQEHIGRTPEELFGHHGVLLRHLIEHVLEGRASITDHRLSSADFGLQSPWRSWSLSLYPVCENEEVVGVGLVADEVAEQALAGEERERLFLEARSAVQVRDDFLSVASHELKTPLTPLSIWLATIERMVERQQAVPIELVRKARFSLDKLTNLINDLLDVTRISADRLALHLQDVDLGELVRRAVTVASGARPGPIDTRLPEEPVIVEGDPGRLEQVIAGLLDNASKYSAPETSIEIGVKIVDGMAELSVEDHGIGIPEKQRRLLFERYFRAANASRRSVGGLGLGLYISRDIIDRHGGRIWVESMIGRGSTFHISLPLSRGGPRQKSTSSR